MFYTGVQRLILVCVNRSSLKCLEAKAGNGVQPFCFASVLFFISEKKIRHRITIGKLSACFHYSNQYHAFIKQIPLSLQYVRGCVTSSHMDIPTKQQPLSLPFHPPLHVNTSMLECAQTAEHTLTYECHLVPPDVHINTHADIHTPQQHTNNWVRFAGTLSLMCLTFGRKKLKAWSRVAALCLSSIRALQGFILQPWCKNGPRQS